VRCPAPPQGAPRTRVAPFRLSGGQRSRVDTHQRRFMADCKASVPAAQRLCGLRKRLASTEVIQTIRAISEAASELALTAPDDLLSDIGEFVDRCAEKAERLAPMTVPKAVSEKPIKRQAAQVHATDRVGQQSPAIDMRISEWTIDEYGNRSRVAWNRADGMSPPSPSPPP
jgi:hypothetical protein